MYDVILHTSASLRVCKKPYQLCTNVITLYYNLILLDIWTFFLVAADFVHFCFNFKYYPLKIEILYW